MNDLYKRCKRAVSLLLVILLVTLSTGFGPVVSRVDAATWETVTKNFGTTSNNWVAYGNGTWLLFSDLGDYGTTTNGTTWTKAPQPFLCGVRDALYDGTQWIAACSGGQIFTLAGGEDPMVRDNWILRNSGKTNNLVSIATDGTKLVMVGESGGVLLSSNDGHNWSDRSISDVFAFNSVTYGQGKFIAVGRATDNSFVIYSSINGDDWSKVSTAVPTKQLYSVAYGNGMFVAVGLAGYIYVSDDGVTWSVVTPPAGTAAIGFSAVTFGAGKFYVGGTNETIITSSDGHIWTSENTGGTKAVRSIEVGGGKVIASGYNGLLKIAAAALSNDARLQNLTVTPGSLLFNADKEDYDVSVPYGTPTIAITPTVSDSGATVTVAGQSAGTGITQNITLDANGSTLIPVTVTAADGSATKTYHVNVYEEAASTNARLKLITVTNGIMTPSTFNPATLQYNVRVGEETSSTTFTPVLDDPTATMQIVKGGQMVSWNSGDEYTIILNKGEMVPVEIVVTAQDRTHTESYELELSRDASSNANLSALGETISSLDTPFNANHLDYVINLPYPKNEIGFAPVLADSSASYQIMIDGVQASPVQAMDIALTPGVGRVIEVTVIAQNGTVSKTYKVQVNRAMPNTDTTLSGLFVEGTLVPGFQSTTYEYDIHVPYTKPDVDVTWTLGNTELSTYQVRVDGNPVVATEVSDLDLIPGVSRIVEVQVTAQDGTTTKTYKVTINRSLPNTDATLNGLFVEGTLVSDFQSTRLNYDLSVPYAKPDVDVTWTLGNTELSTYQVRVDGLPMAVTELKDLALTPGVPKIVEVQVTAQDSTTTNTYTMTLTRSLPNMDATLSGLFIDGTLAKDFQSNTFEYDLTVPYTKSNVDVTWTLGDSESATYQVKVDGAPRAVTEVSDLDLTPGLHRTIEVQVTAQDGTTTKTYTVIVTRSLPNTDATLSGLFVDGTLIPDFQSTTLEYNLSIPYVNSEVDVTWTLGDTDTATYQVLVDGTPMAVTELSDLMLDPSTSKTIKIQVTAEDTTVKAVYTLQLTRAEPAVPVINSHPENATVFEGATAELSVAASNAVAYAWQADTGSGFINIADGTLYSGVNTSKLNITGASMEMNGYQYRVIVSGVGATSATSNKAVLTVTEAATYSVEPLVDQNLASLTQGYGTDEQETRTVTITNNGTGTLTNLTVALSGPQADAFEISQPLLNTLSSEAPETTFTVRAKNGLEAGSYTATVTLTADNMASVTFSTFQSINLPDAPANPQGLTAKAGDQYVDLNWNAVTGATYYDVYVSTASGKMDDSPYATVTDAVYQVGNLTNGTTYYFVVKAGNDGGISAASNEASATPATVPGTPTQISAVAGNGQATVTFIPPSDNGGSAITGYLVSASPGNVVMTGTKSPLTITGLTNGVQYTFTVKAINSAGESAPSDESNMVMPKASDSQNENPQGGSSQPVQSQPQPSPPPVTPGVEVIVNGKKENGGTAKTETVNGQRVTTVLVDEEKLKQRLEAEGAQAIITIPITDGSDVTTGVLNGRMVKLLEDKQATIELRSGNSIYMLPASQINIDAISKQFGSDLALQDILINIEIAKPLADTLQVVKEATERNGLTEVIPPLNFKVTAVFGDRTEEVSKFNAFVVRKMLIPDGVDPNRITTGVVIEPDGTVRHVPTKVVKVDGQYYAQINSLTNSIYSVVWHPLEFNDVTNHWAKESINNMGSRMVVSGTGNDVFNPNQDITRAEFAAMIVRGLGLKLEDGPSRFNDVKTTDWYSSAVNTAYEYKIINGFGDNTFLPNEKITREQAMVITANAMRITGLNGQFTNSTAMLQPYRDHTQVSTWAITSVADTLQAGVVSGRNNMHLAPRDYITRAEVATIIERLLEKSDLI
ncbi:cadherin-like beta sandwich domain-containing protein [Paenibacillus illinoisensis]|uniref:cadherin-like beta sandwich domain-containing protein n=1 Tax=Paenibacillus illinoisensis TaxID=59845 RepID=UPI00301B12FF